MRTNKLVNALKDYGADYEGIIDRFMDDAELYEDCFAKFLADRQIALLSDSIAAGDYQAAFQAAHALKGLSGNLGLTPLFTVVCQLVESLRAQDYSQVQTQYEEVAAQLQLLSAFLAILSSGEKA